MGTLTIEFDDNILAAAIVSAIGTGSATAVVETDSGSDDDAYTADEFIALCAEAKAATSPKDLKEALAEFEFKTPKAASKADAETLAEMVEVLKDMADGVEDDGDDDDAEDDDDAGDDDTSDDDDDDDDDDGDDEGVDLATVKKACQAYGKENGKEALTELLDEFDVKSVAKLKTLEQDDLDELYAELQG